MDSYIHGEEPVGPGAPMLFLFHGTGGDEAQMLRIGRQVLPGGHLIAPRGDVLEQGAARYFRRLGEGLYDMADLGRAVEKMGEFVAHHIAKAAPAAVFGLGYSNGANILAALLLARPELFDGAGLLHPLIPYVLEPGPSLAGRRVLVTAGRHDPIASVAQTEELSGLLAGRGARVEIVWHEGGHQVAPLELAAARRFLLADVNLPVG